MESLISGKSVQADELREYLVSHGQGNAKRIAADLKTTPLRIATTCADNPQLFTVHREGQSFIISLH